MSAGRPADPIVLAVAPHTAGALDPHGHVLVHTSRPAQDQPDRSTLLGFSSGAELVGLPLAAGEGVLLLSDQEVAGTPALGDPDLSGPIYRLRFDHYLERLARARVNYLKVLAFDATQARWSPIARLGGDLAPEASATGVSEAYLERLEELVRKARARGIVVCLSLFASRMLRDDGWAASPFNASNNNTGDAAGAGAFVVGPPLAQFCVIRPPPAGRAFADMTVAEKLYTVQRELVTRLVETTRRYWNVVYEICDDPRGPGDPAAMTEVVEWHATVAGWLYDLLADHRGRRRRLIEVNARPPLRAALLDAMTGLVDLVQLRGGEWGGYPALDAAEACALRSDRAPGKDLLAAGAIAGGTSYRGVSWDGVDGAIAALADRPVAVVCDTDLHHLAQKVPQRYAAAVDARRGHFVYRWTRPYLHEVDVAGESCAEIGELGQPFPAGAPCGCAIFGLDQRLDLLAEAQASAFPLPPPPPAPVLREASTDGTRVELAFDPPAVEPERYELFLGGAADTAWAGTDLYPDPLPVERTPTGGRVVLPTEAPAGSLWVALAAVRGVLTSDLSEPLPISVAPHGAELIAADLPSEVETRRDYGGSVTFLNSGTTAWRGREEGAGAVTLTGALFQAEGLAGGLAALFIPLPADQVVYPGATVKIDVKELQLDGPFAQTYGERVPVLLPYSRRAIRFRVGMARRLERRAPDAAALEEPAVSYEPIGQARDTLPDGRPIAVTVRQPRRLATRHVVEQHDTTRDPLVLPLADGVDRSLHLVSVIGSDAAPGTVVRTRVLLSRLLKEAGMPTRVAIVEPDGAGGALHLEVDVVRLHPLDVYYGLPVEPPRHRSHDLAAGARETVPLGGFAGVYTLTIGSADARLAGGDSIRWKTLAEAPGGARLTVTGAADAPARVTTFTAALVEDPAGADPREIFGAATVPAGGVVYAPLGDAGAHRFLIARLAADRDADVTADVVLRANEAGVLERALELRSTDAAPAAVRWRVLQIAVDASPAHNRRPDEIHPIHAGRILEFFNQVQEANQIVDAMRDNRSYHRDTRRAYAIRPKLAHTILSARAKLGGAFTTLDQIDAVAGVGPDTFEDIAFTFDDEGTPIGVAQPR